jgi:hypothetical protein
MYQQEINRKQFGLERKGAAMKPRSLIYGLI